MLYLNYNVIGVTGGRHTELHDKLFFIYTYGSGYGEAFAHVKLAAREAGMKLNYINAVIMVDNYLPIFDMQEQMDTLPQKDVEGQIEKICQDIAERKETPVTVGSHMQLTREVKNILADESILNEQTGSC